MPGETMFMAGGYCGGGGGYIIWFWSMTTAPFIVYPLWRPPKPGGCVGGGME